ncbi:uncharacterized protein TNCV_3269461 [Trichonephila clavipes]|nr:uncharacterized protein TNCV_3269461 [Trichonephila clavipes]
MEAVDTCLASEPMTDDLSQSWTIFKKTVLDKARSCIPRGNGKHYVPYFAHNTYTLSSILEKRKCILKTFSGKQAKTKKSSPFRKVESQNIFNGEVNPSSLQCILYPSKGLSNFYFNLSLPIIKRNFVSSHLRHLALEIINIIPNDAIKIYTDGSRISNQTGSGIYIVPHQEKLSLKKRNPDFSSVFRSELLAIDVGLDAILHKIITDSL